MILDVRGTHGSGKSTVMITLLKEQQNRPIRRSTSNKDWPGKVVGHSLPDLKAGIVARYHETGGGCDAIGGPLVVCDLVRRFHRRYRHTLLEGILVSHTFQRYADLADELGKRDYTFCFLDTPLELCIERVKARRLAKGNTKPFDPKNVVKDWHQVFVRVQGQLVKGGYSVEVLDHRDPMPQIREMLCR